MYVCLVLQALVDYEEDSDEEEDTAAAAVATPGDSGSGTATAASNDVSTDAGGTENGEEQASKRMRFS